MVKKFQAGKLPNEQPDTSTANPNMQDKDTATKLILDIYRAYQKIQKHIPNKENVFSGFLTDTYKHYMQNKVSDEFLKMSHYKVIYNEWNKHCFGKIIKHFIP